MGHGLQSPEFPEKTTNRYVKALFFVLFAVVIFCNYYFYYPITGPYFSENILKILKALFALFVFAESSFFLGNGICKLAGGLSDPPGKFYITFAIGAAAISSVVLALALLGLFYSLFFWMVSFVSVLAVFFYAKEQIVFISEIEKSLQDCPVSTVYILIMLLISFCLALSPTVESDALRYHVALPAHMIQTHGFFYYPYNAFYQFPAFIETQFAITQFIGDTLSPKLVHWFYFALTIGLLTTFLKRFFSSINPITPTVIFASTPFVSIISGWAYVETAQTFYILIGLYLIFLLREEKFNQQIFLFLGIVLGSLLGIKYPMMAIAPIYILFAVIILWKRDKKFLIQGLCVLLLPLLFVALPWFIKNVVYTGNPVYPFAYSHFGGEDWNDQNTQAYMSLAQGKGDLFYSQKQGILYRGMELFLLPFKATMNPQSFELYESMHKSWLYKQTRNRLLLPVNFSDWQLGPIYLIFLPLLFLSLFRLYKKKERDILSLISYLLIFIFWNYLVWAETYRDNRFLLPILPLMAILIGYGFLQYKNIVTKTLLWILLMYNLFWVIQTVVFFHNPLPFIVGGQREDQYIAQKLDYYPSFQYLDQLNFQKKPVLLIGEYHSLYLNSPNFTNDYYDTPVILRVIRGTNQVSEIYARLAEMHVQYILYNENELSKYLYDFTGHFQSAEEKEMYIQFLSSLSSKTIKRFDITRDVSQDEAVQIRQFMNDPQRDPRAIYIFKI
jgi:4-amino-4-deoxy-L-arabinose transferase-like glycosyltransferase